MRVNDSRNPSWRLQRTPLSTIAVMAIVALAALPAQAQKVDIAELRVGVQDMATKKELDPVRPGELLMLKEGQSVRLRMVAIPSEKHKAPRYPSTKFSLNTTKRNIAIDRIDEKQGSAVIKANGPTQGPNPVLVMFEILADDIAYPPGKMKGTISVKAE